MKTGTFVFEDFYVRFENLFKYFFSPSRQTARKNLKRNRTLTDSEIILLAQVLGNMTDFYTCVRPSIFLPLYTCVSVNGSGILFLISYLWLSAQMVMSRYLELKKLAGVSAFKHLLDGGCLPTEI